MSRFGRPREDERGFTLIELLVVIVLLGLLGGIAVPLLMRQSRKASVASMQADTVTIRTGLIAYFTEHATFGPEEVITESGGAAGPALAEFVFRASQGNNATTLHDDLTASFCIVVNNVKAQAVLTYGYGTGTVALGCTAGYTTGDTVDPAAQADVGRSVVSRPLKGESPVCTNPASVQAKQNMRCPGY